MIVSFVTHKMSQAMNLLDKNQDQMIDKTEFQRILTDAEVVTGLYEVGVDPMDLIDLAETIFQDRASGANGLTFRDFVEVVLDLRGGKECRVKDITCLKKSIKKLVEDSQKPLEQRMKQLDENMKTLMEKFGLEHRTLSRTKSKPETRSAPASALDASPRTERTQVPVDVRRSPRANNNTEASSYTREESAPVNDQYLNSGGLGEAPDTYVSTEPCQHVASVWCGVPMTDSKREGRPRQRGRNHREPSVDSKSSEVPRTVFDLEEKLGGMAEDLGMGLKIMQSLLDELTAKSKQLTINQEATQVLKERTKESSNYSQSLQSPSDVGVPEYPSRMSGVPSSRPPARINEKSELYSPSTLF
eukprot:TRINITY_DN117389_c0_g1_i1.p1 TRINITY_DN117389_c0_g1~~TRINITY_DN117389_c0_g1_i1.p1  ORF type:complete len:359 (+),score=40.55 TRINITY_DN117389_c0_g1_i1:1-1077(+)